MFVTVTRLSKAVVLVTAISSTCRKLYICFFKVTIFLASIPQTHWYWLKYIPHCRTGPSTWIWNGLRSNIRSASTREQFKRSLKSWLFECAYGRRRVWGTFGWRCALKICLLLLLLLNNNNNNIFNNEYIYIAQNKQSSDALLVLGLYLIVISMAV